MKNIKLMKLEEFIDLVHDTANEFYGMDTEISIIKGKNGYTINDDYNGWFSDGVNIRDCYEHLYYHLLEEIEKEKIEEVENIEFQKGWDSYEPTSLSLKGVTLKKVAV